MPPPSPDCYKVEVIHYINPHLIWIEVCDTNFRNEDFIFEQVGVYGVLPLKSSLDVENNDIQYQKCDNWVIASTTTMKKVLSDSIEVWFSPTFIDKRSSIFDDNIHKYGEFIIKLESGTYEKLSKLLIKSNVARFEPNEFHLNLSSGLLNTKLSSRKTGEVVKEIEKYYISGSHIKKKDCKKSIEKQTSTFHMSQDLEKDLSVLTATNLEKHNNKILNAVLENKMKDFELCKDIDEDSVGRGIGKSTKGNHKNQLNNTRKQVSPDISQSFGDIKTFLDNSNKRNHTSHSSDCSTSTGSNLNLFMLKKLNIVEHLEQKNFVNKFEDEQLGDDRPLQKQINKIAHHKESIPQLTPVPKKNILTQAKTSANVNYKPVKQDTRPNLVAFGPPGMNPMSFKSYEVNDESVEVLDKVTDMVVENYSPLRENKNDNDSHLNLNVKNTSEFFNKVNKCRMSALEEPMFDHDEPIINHNNNVLKNSTNIVIKEEGGMSFMLKKKLKVYDSLSTHNSSFSSSDTSNKDTSSASDNKMLYESFSDVIQTMNESFNVISNRQSVPDSNVLPETILKNNVNPFKNIDPNISVFVDKLISPVLMVHAKHNKRIQPVFEMRDVFFNSHIHIVLRNMSIQRPMMLQNVSWNTILRGCSLFMISPPQSGKTLGYLPAVCRLVSDMNSGESGGPTCIIVCATSKSVAYVEEMAKMFLGLEERILACYAGVDDLYVTTTLLNGCDLLISTPSYFTRLLQMNEYGVDLRRLSLFVLEDCERLSSTYSNEIKFFLLKIKETLKSRVNNELKVQYILASRIWCDFMEPLAKKAPDTVISIGAFQECVLYSKSSTSVSIVNIENKINAVFEFLKDIDASKKTVIVCKSDDEVDMLVKALKCLNYTIFSCNNEMTVNDLFNLSISWGDYNAPLVGALLVCCDGNLTHMNITDAYYLIHYSLPQLFSMFCKRFCVLNDNYPSIFARNSENVKIKILLDDSNVEQLPKVMNFIKRCTTNVPNILDELCDKISKEKELIKAKNYVPVCDNLIIFGNCPDIYYCQERHAVFKEYDTPDEWMPKEGIVTFTILHYHTAIFLSARLISHTQKGVTTKYPQTYSSLSMKLGMYYSKNSNRKLHGIPKIGDICTVSLTLNSFRRCQVVKILSEYQNGKPNGVLVNLIDEEKYEVSKDIYLYYLPDEFKNVKTNIVRIRLVNLKPKDKDITFSGLAISRLKKITDNDNLFLRGHVSLTLGNCVFVDTLEACQELTSLNETVVKSDLKKELLNNHAQLNPDQTQNIEKLCNDSGIEVFRKEIQVSETPKPVKLLPKGEWAFLESDTLSTVFLSSLTSPDKFFVSLVKFHSCMKILSRDIQKYTEDYNITEELHFKEGDLVLAEWPEDAKYERARIDRIFGEEVECFFVDQGDWREIPLKKLIPITEKLINQLPFQAIECRLIGVESPSENWPEISLNWFYDNCYEDIDGCYRTLYIQRFSKETAEFTDGYKYGVALISTHTDRDVVINKSLIELNLARLIDQEQQYIDNVIMNLTRRDNPEEKNCSENNLESKAEVNEDDFETIPQIEQNNLETVAQVDQNYLPKEIHEIDENGDINNKISQAIIPRFDSGLIRSVPLISEDDDDFDKWDGAGFSNELVSTLINPKRKPEPIIETQSDTNKNESFLPGNIKLKQIMDCRLKSTQELDSDDFSSTENLSTPKSPETRTIVVDQTRRPSVLWRQKEKDVRIKINLIDVKDYNLKIDERAVKFSANVNDIAYAFDIELYGVINKDKCSHYKTGMYIVIKLEKILNTKWMMLSKSFDTRSFISYDADNIDDDDDDVDDDDEIIRNDFKNIIKENRSKDNDSDSDDGFRDDVKYSYDRN